MFNGKTHYKWQFSIATRGYLLLHSMSIDSCGFEDLLAIGFQWNAAFGVGWCATVTIQGAVTRPPKRQLHMASKENGRKIDDDEFPCDIPSGKLT